MFKEYQGKQITRKAFEITSPRQIHVEYDNLSGKERYGLLTEQGCVEFVAHEKVNVGDFVVYLNDKDVYHCNRKVFLERNEYPSESEFDFKRQAQSMREIENLMRECGCEGVFISVPHIVERIAAVEFKTIVLAGQKMMFCGIRMKGGFVVVGEPATCINPTNWRDKIGREVSFKNAFENIYQLEAYLNVEGGE